MTHDPLCPYVEFIPCCEFYLEHEYPQPAKQHSVACRCDLIAKVRADQSIRAANRLLQGVLVEGTPIFGCPICPDIWESEPSCEHYEVAERFADMVGQP
jgi:hypothetical protein